MGKESSSSAGDTRDTGSGSLNTGPEPRVLFLGQEDSLEEEMSTHSSILAWRIPWTKEPGGQQSIESQSV